MGDQWVKQGDWELGGNVIKFDCFDYKLNWMKKFDGANFRGMLQ